jgi:hypothetical protein
LKLRHACELDVELFLQAFKLTAYLGELVRNHRDDVGAAGFWAGWSDGATLAVLRKYYIRPLI